MAGISEVGHSKNVSNFHKLLSYIRMHSAYYQPSIANWEIPQLEILLHNAENALDEVIAKNAAYNVLVNERRTAFKKMKELSSRIMTRLSACRVSPATIDDANSFYRKIQGRRASARSTPAVDLAVEAANYNSASQQSYTQLVQHFSGLVSTLENIPSYNPLEAEFQVANLRTLKDDLNTKNKSIDNAYTDIVKARSNRNEILYNDENSVYKIATEIKKYLKSIFGNQSEQYAKIKKLVFSKQR